jgi:hypothetical protein
LFFVDIPPRKRKNNYNFVPISFFVHFGGTIMLKKVGLLSLIGMVACVGCSAIQYAAITSGIVNTGVIAGAIAGFPLLANLLTSLGIAV